MKHRIKKFLLGLVLGLASPVLAVGPTPFDSIVLRSTGTALTFSGQAVGTLTDTSTSGTGPTLLSIATTVAPASNSTATSLTGSFTLLGSGAFNLGTLYGLNGAAYHGGTGNVTNLIGFNYGGGALNGSSGTITAYYNTLSNFATEATAAASFTNAYGDYVSMAHGGTGTIATLTGSRIGFSLTSTGNVTNAYGINIDSPLDTGGGAYTNIYGLHINDQSVVGSGTRRNVWSRGAGENRFEGVTEIGGTATGPGDFRILEDTDLGSNYASFIVPSLAANTVYTLPPDDGDAGEQLQTDGSGVLTWESSGGGAPSDATYLTATSNGTLSAEVVVTPTDDNVIVANGTTWEIKALTDCNAGDSAVTYDTATNVWGCNTITGGGYDTVDDEDTPLTQRTTLNFEGAGVTCADDTDQTTCTIPGGSGSAITFDIGDDGGNDSVDVNEIATSGDTNAIFTEPSADKILIDLTNNWPTADAVKADGVTEAALKAVDAAGDEECLTYETTTGDFEWQACGSGSGKPWEKFTAPQAFLPAASYATQDTRNTHPVLDFDAAADECAYFGGYLNSTYAGGGLSVVLAWMATSATTGATGWLVSIEAHPDDALDLDADSFVADNSSSATTASASGEVQYTTIGFTDGADMDSLAAGESYRLRVCRDGDGSVVTDDMTGDAELYKVLVLEP